MSDDLPALLGGRPVRPQGPPDWPPDDPAVAEALRQAATDRSWGRYHGPHGERLAGRLAATHGCEHVVLCASGTAAVELALRGLKVGPGDEVVLAAYDFKGNFGDVLTVGARPVLVDVDPHNWNLDPGRLEEATGPATKAILVSHLHGGIVPMPAVMDVARQHGLPVIEDACQMPGAVVSGKIAGTWGDVGVLSFGGSKLLSAGRGGAFFTNNAEIVQRARLYSHRGNEAYPLSELQAAVLLPQLDRLDEWNARRAENAALLCELLADSGLVPFRNATVKKRGLAPSPYGSDSSTSVPRRCLSPFFHSESMPGYYKLGFQYEPERFAGLPRDAFAQAMRAEGIALDAGFRGLHRTHSARRYRAAGDLPHATAADERVLVLHHPVLLGDADDVRQVAAAVQKIRCYAADLAARP